MPPGTNEQAPIIEQVMESHPDLVYVGFGSPKQEFVIDALRCEVPSAWLMGCGISLSFIAGDVRRAPVWMQRAGLEWVHRMIQEPRRLAARYLLRNLPFALSLMAKSHWSRSRR